MASTDIQGFILWAAGLTQSDIILNDLLLKLDRRLNLHVLSRAELGPPGGDSDGDIYIMPSGTLTGAWSGFAEHDVVLLRGGTWYAEAPIAGLGAYVADEAVGIIFTGSVWTETLIAGVVADSDFPAEGLMRAVDGAGDYTSIKTNLTAVADPTVDDDSTAGYSEFSPWISWAASDPVLFICLDPSEGAALWQAVGASDLLDNLAATADPTVDNDETEGYSIGSRWINVTADTFFVCVDATTGAAVWLTISGLSQAQVVAIPPDLTPSAYSLAGVTDDGVAEINLGKDFFAGFVHVATNRTPHSYASIAFRAASSSAMCALIAGTNVEVTTGELTAGAGTDGFLTVSAHTDNKIYFSNRTGFTVTMAVQVSGVSLDTLAPP